MTTPRPPHLVARWVAWFERRGVYEHEQDTHRPYRFRDFGLPVAAWLLCAALFVVFFAVAT